MLQVILVVAVVVGAIWLDQFDSSKEQDRLHERNK